VRHVSAGDLAAAGRRELGLGGLRRGGRADVGVRWWRCSQNAFPASWLVSDGSKNRNRKSSSAGTSCRATAVTSGCLPSVSPARCAVPTRTSRRAPAGWRRVRAWAMVPPMERPSTSACCRPRLPRKAAVSSARSSMVSEGLAAGPGGPGVVEQDHRPAGGQPVGDQGITVVHAVAEVLDEYQRRPGLGPELAVGVPDSSGLCEPGGRGDMRISWHGVPSFLTGRKPIGTHSVPLRKPIGIQRTGDMRHVPFHVEFRSSLSGRTSGILRA